MRPSPKTGCGNVCSAVQMCIRDRFITEGTHEAIVGREEFEKAQLVIKSNSHKVLMGGVDLSLIHI